MAVTGLELQLLIVGNNASAMQALQQTQAQAQQTSDNINRTFSQVLIGHQLESWGQGLLDFSNSFVNVGADFQQSIQFINRLTSSTADGFDQLQNKAITLARTSIFSAQNIVDGMEQLAREGFNVSQIVDGGMNSMIDASVNMATALGTSIPESANMIGQLERVFADQGLSAGQVADIVTQAVLRSGQGLQQFAGGLQYVAAQADMTNTPLATVATMVSYLESQLIKGRNAGTSLRTMFQNLEAPTGKVADELAALGISTTDANGNFIGIMATIDALHNAYGNLSPAAQEAANKILFGSYATSATLELIRGGMPAFDAFAKKEGDVGSAADIAHTKMSNLAGSLHNFTSSLFDVQIVLGESVSGIIKPFIDAANMLIGVFLFLPTPVHAAVAALIIVAGVVASLTGAIILFNAVGGMEMVGASVSAALAMIGGAIDIFVPELWVVIAVLGAAILIFNALGLTLGNVQDKWDTFWKVFAGTEHNDPKNWHWGELASTIDAFGNAIKFVFGQSAFTDWLNQTAIAVQDALDLFDRLTKKGVNPLAAALEALGFAFTGSGFAGIGSFLAGLGKDVDTFTQTFDKFRKGGVDPVTASLYALSAVFQSHGLTGLADWFGVLGDAVDAFVQGDYSGALDDFKASLEGLVSGIADLNIPQVIVNIGGWAWGTIVQPLGEWILGHLPGFADVRQGASAAVVALKEVAVTIGGWAVSLATGVQDLWSKVSTWILQETSPDWMRQGGRAVPIPSVSVAIQGWALDHMADLGTWLYGKLRDTAVWLVSVAVNISGWAAGKIADLGGWLFTRVHDVAVWLVTATINIGGWTDGKIADLGSWLYGKLRGTAVWLVSISVNIANWAVGKIADLTAWLSKAEQGCYADLKSIMVNIANWAPGAIADLGTWLYARLRDTKVFLVKVAVSIADWSIDLSQSDFAGAVVAAVKRAISSAKNFGQDIAESIWNAIGGFQGWASLDIGAPYDLGATIGGAIHNAIVKGIKNLKDADWKQILDDIAYAMVTAAAAAPTIMMNVATAIISGLTGFMISLVAGPQAASDFKQFMSGIVTGVADAVTKTNWSGVASSIFHAIVDKLKDLGRQINPFDLIFGGSSDGGAKDVPNVNGGKIPKIGDLNAGGLIGPGANGSALSGLLGNFFSSGDLSRNGAEPIKIPAPDFSQVKTALADIAKLAQTSGQDFNRNLTTGLTAAKTSAATILSSVNTTVTVWANEMRIHATSGGQWFRDQLNAGLQSAKSSAATTFTQILSNAVTWANDMITRGRMGGIGFASGLSSEHWSVASAAADLFNAAIGNLQGGYNSAFNSGYNIGAGFADGMRSQLGNVADAAIALSNASSSTITTRNVIQSPSRLYRWFGQMIGQGFALGIDDQRPLVASSASRLLAAPNTARVAGGGYAIGANTQHVSITNHITVPAADFPEWIKTVEFVQSLGRSRQMVKGTP